jgi:diguanylate cyclase (GGDEF)-like protein
VAVGAVLAGAHALGVLGPLSDLTFLIFGIGALGAMIVGVRRYRPRLRWPWWCISVALVLFVIGGAAREYLGTLGNLTATRSLLPDLITIPGYCCLGVALSGLAHVRRRRGGDLDALLDGIVAALAALSLAWALLITPVLGHLHTPMKVRIVVAVYPPLSVAFVAIAARFAFNPLRARTQALRYLVAGLASMVVGDVLYMLVELGVLQHMMVLDLPYALAFVAVGGCMLHPSMRQITEPVPVDASAPTRGRLGFVALALCVPAIVSVTRGEGSTGDRLVQAAIVIALTVTAVWRVLRALQAHARSERRLGYQATHDALTGLPNRAAARDQIRAALNDAVATGSYAAVLFLDLDRFKLVNDTFGHILGDDLLVAIARRLAAVIGPPNVVARIGGDEFLVILTALQRRGEALEVGELLREHLHAPFIVGNSEVYTSVSIGLSTSAGLEPGVNADSLIRDADTAMYQAKEAGRDGVAVFASSMRDRVLERLALERELRFALERGQLRLHFQAMVTLPSGRLDGFEALLRWTHPTRGQVPPSAFIPVAEDTGLIVDIGAWVLWEACAAVAHWRRSVPGGADLRVSVNLSARQLKDTSLLDVVGEALVRNGLPGSSLCLEITESLLMDNPDAAAELLSRVRALGVRLSIDDFGTGYSSLAYLKRFPVGEVKIDRSFVDGLDCDDSAEESLVAAIIAMAGALGMATTAEGVETLAQGRRLLALGCSGAQGFLISRPVPASDVAGTVARLGLWSPRAWLEAPTEARKRRVDRLPVGGSNGVR